ncbi:MAG: glycogen/starch synthase [Patescibacteria group bacterium]|nr:glycogen/starch synthase [Patescibacteria group bacterium]
MNNKPLKILIAATEVTPLAKVGGLGDVIGALPKALNKLNLDARVIIPCYGAIDRNKYKIKLIKQNIKVGGASINLWQTNLPDSNVPVYLVEHSIFHGKKIYSTALADGPADIKKYLLFARAILEAVKNINFKPDIIHANDWPTGGLIRLLKNDYQDDQFFKQTKTLFTIHNLAHQGPAGAVNYMAEGILNADIVSTVSPTYAKEILTKEYGAGLEKILAKRKNELYGILNGIDIDFFNPASDELIRQNYSSAMLEKKSLNKLALQKKLGLPPKKNTALAGVVTRFVWQKGIDLITEKSVKAILGSPQPCQFVFLGTGEKRYENALLRLTKKFPDKISVQIKFDEKLAHEIYAGTDLFLVPSRFEPCGLTQMIAMRYGNVPLVRSTGGLKDSITNYQLKITNLSKKPTGFLFKKFASAEFYKTLTRALNIYYQEPGVWRQLQLNGMKQNFSWEKSAKEYLKLYKKLRGNKK